MQTDFWYTVARSLAALEAPAAVGKRAAERALGQLGARRIATGEYPVVFDSPTARNLLGSLVGCLSGYAVYRKRFLPGGSARRIHRRASGITVIDDGRLPAGLGSRPFDGEGQPTRRNVIVEKGRLRSYLLRLLLRPQARHGEHGKRLPRRGQRTGRGLHQSMARTGRRGKPRRHSRRYLEKVFW